MLADPYHCLTHARASKPTGGASTGSWDVLGRSNRADIRFRDGDYGRASSSATDFRARRQLELQRHTTYVTAPSGSGNT